MQVPICNRGEKIFKASHSLRRWGDDELSIRNDEIHLSPVNELGFDGKRLWNP